MRPIRIRRASLRGSAIESLEERGLLSSVAPVISGHVELPIRYQAAAELSSSTARSQGTHTTSTHSAARDPDDRGRTAKSGNGDDPASTPVVRDNPAASSEVRELASQDLESRELDDALVVETRRNDLVSDDPADDPPAIEQEMTSGLSQGGAADSAAASLLVGWGSAAAIPVNISMSILRGQIVGPDDRAGGSATETMPGSFGNLVPEFQVARPARGDAATAPAIPGDEPSQLPVSAASPVREAPARAWADILDGTLRPEWEAVDGELQQFLSWLSGSADHPDAPGTGPAWPLWIGTATAVLLARRVSYGRPRLFRRQAPGTIWISARRPIPVGPWPLGLP
jgi:hypothetical protein